MSELAPVEKPIRQEWLDKGEVVLTANEAAKLGLRDHLAEVSCVHGGDVFVATWCAADRKLSGELFGEALQLNGQINGLIRLHPTGDRIELNFVESSAAWSRAPIPKAEPPRLPTVPRPTPRSKKRRRVGREDRYRLRERGEYAWKASVGIHEPTLREFVQNLTTGGWDRAETVELRILGEQLAALGGFDELVALGVVRVDRMPYQEATALRALAHMGGRAILADEVGLGKTVEAGIILKELVLRGMARRILILCPATLRDQWRTELLDKFDESFDVIASGKEPLTGDRLIMSLNLGARNVDELASQRWDLVIIDEAHRVSGHAKKSQQLVRELGSRYLLMLTATPVQNNLLELYRLVSLLRPGTFVSERDFKQRFLAGSDDKQPSDPAGLRKLVSDVMIRTTRTQAGLDNVTRYAKDVPVTLSAVERQAYDLCTILLRKEMSQPQDAMRRRHLAHRLTTSPRSLAQTARRMSESHPSGRARELLSELSDLCIEFGLTNRQRKLLDLVGKWTADADKGKVLIFTQHADTLEDLLRVLAEKDIEAVPFHGGMNARAKAKSIESFHKKIDVMISTDSGAEGLNLQFANCVVNYDLPWNPMRIEQRIGRVHRVTQKRDVHVANFFAKDTVDEHVYRLLHDKLRMFELLFGQVTTILGEIEVDDRAGFEAQIMDALTSANDQEMARRLSQFGEQVDAAYERAQEMMRAGAGINTWYADMEHRKQMPEGTELMPKVKRSKRDRQKEVEAFVRAYLAHFDAEITHDRKKLISAKVPEQLVESLDGRTELHLAFDFDGLSQHSDAELCAVGSEVFDELISSLRDDGDLVATVPRMVDPGSDPWIAHSQRLRLVRREVEGPVEWLADATWRIRSDASTVRDAVVTTYAGDQTDPESWKDWKIPESVAPRRSAKGRVEELVDGEALPIQLPTPQKLVADVVRQSRVEFAKIQGDAQHSLDRKAEAEVERLEQHYTTLIEERVGQITRSGSTRKKNDLEKEVEQLRGELRRVRSSAKAQAELRVDLLAMQVEVLPVFQIRETWETERGARFDLEGTWHRTETAVVYPALLDAQIEMLDVCDRDHLVDTREMVTCPGCTSNYCEQCRPLGELRPCPACGAELCGACRSGKGGLCGDCAEPRRAPELDTSWGVGWSLGREACLVVGEGAAILDDGQGTTQTFIAGASDEFEERLRSHAVGLELGGGPGIFRVVEQCVDPDPLPAGIIDHSEHVSSEWAVERGDETATEVTIDLPPAPVPDNVVPQAASGFAHLLTSLRAACPPPNAACLVVRETRERSWIEFNDRGLERVREVARGVDVEQERRVITFAMNPDPTGVECASAEDGEVTLTLRRVHASYELLVRRTSDDHASARWFIPGAAGVSAESEQAMEELRISLGLSAGTTLWMSYPVVPLAASFAEPTAVRLVHRTVEPEWVVDQDRTFDQDRAGVRIPTEAEVRELFPSGQDVLLIPVLTGTMRDALLTMARGVDRHANRRALLRRRLIVTETWAGHKEVSRSRVVEPGDPAWPILDDTNRPANDFEIDDGGHLHEVAAGWHCTACGKDWCRACSPSRSLKRCLKCAREACRVCCTTAHPDVVSEWCEICDARSCDGCGRQLDCTPCRVCARRSCADCLEDQICRTCRTLEFATPAEVADLPSCLLADGLTVVMRSDAAGQVVGLVGLHRREVVVLKDGHIVRWVSLTDESAELLETRFIVAWLSGVSDTELRMVSRVRRPRRPPTPDLLRSKDHAVFAYRMIGGDDHGVETTVRIECAPWESLRDGLSRVVHERGLVDGFSVQQFRPDPITGMDPVLVPGKGARGVDSLAAAVFRRTVGPPGVTSARTIEVDHYWTRDAVRIGVDGLSVDTGPIGSPLSTQKFWRSVPVDEVPEVRGWFPRPDRVHTSAVKSDRALLIGFGRYVLLLLDIDGEVRLERIDAESGFPDSLLLAAAIEGATTDLDVADTVPPADTVPFELVGGTRVAARIYPKLEPSLAARNRGELKRAVHFWASTRERMGMVAEVSTLSFELRENLHHQSLAGLAGSLLPDTFTVGVRSLETWTTPTGTVEVSAETFGVDPHLRVVAYDSGKPVGKAMLDRSGHVVERADTCPYCRQHSCMFCRPAVRSCALCGIQACEACSSVVAGLPAHLCPACASLKTTMRSAFRRRSAQRTVLTGSDMQHQVAVVEGDGPPFLRVVYPGQNSVDQPLDPGDAIKAWLNRLVRSPLYPGVDG